MNINSPIQTMRLGVRSLALALVAMFSVAAIGLSATTYAAPAGDNPTNGAPASKDACKHDGWKKFGFGNQGHCVKWVNAHGYGGGSAGGNHNSVSSWFNLDISGDNNVVNIVVNYLFG